MVGEGDEQVLHLRVSQATILGVTARLEQDAAGLVNIGFWTSIEDAVLFTVTAPRAGRYDVALCYACPAEEAGSQVVLESEEGAALTIAVQATGGFDRYVRHQAPRPLRLPAGESRLRLRPLTLARRALMNLRWLELWPHRPLLPSMEEPAIAVARGAALALQRGREGEPVALLARVVALGPSVVSAEGGEAARALRLLDDAETEVLGAEVSGAALVDRAVAALRGAQRVVVAGQVVRAGRRPRLRVAGLRVATSASEGLAASAAERAEADARLDEWTGGGALEDELLRAALAVLGLGDEAEESVALRARDEQGAPVTRLAQAARLLLLQALGAADALAAEPALAGSPRSHVVLLGAVPSLLPALAGALSLSEAALAPRASVLRGRVQLDDEAGYTATPGGLARLDAGTWVLPLDQAPWRGPAVRECLQEVLEGVIHTPASGALLAPLPVRVRCAVLLHGAPSALLALSGGARAVAAQRAAALALAFTCTLHLDRGSRSGSAVVDQDPDALSAPQRAPLVVDAAAQRGLRLVLARLCDRAAQVDLSEVADELSHLSGALTQVSALLLGDLLAPRGAGGLASSGEAVAARSWPVAARLTAAAARLRGAVRAEPEDVEEAWRVLAFQVEHLRWLRREHLGAAGDEDEEQEALLAPFLERLQRYAAAPSESEAVISEASASPQLLRDSAADEAGVSEAEDAAAPPEEREAERAATEEPLAGEAGDDDPDWTEERG